MNQSNSQIERPFMSASNETSVNDDEIDLSELFQSLWSQKLLIGLVTAACLFLSLVYLLRATPEYEAAVLFEINGQQSRPGLPSELCGLATLAGIDLGNGGGDEGVYDRLRGRDFILGVSDELDLEQDPYFNPYYGDAGNAPLGAALAAHKFLAARLSAESDGIQESRLAQDEIVERLVDAVTAAPTDNGSVSIKTTHENADVAAALANTSMNRLLTALEEERKRNQENQLAYLSEQLADALTAMNEAQDKVQEFALQNSLVSTAAFATRSEQMFRLREDLQRHDAMNAATVELLTLVGANADLTARDYERLRAGFPIVDDVDFRRRLGIPTQLDHQVWPDETRLLEFRNILADRKACAQRELEMLQAEAEEYARASEILTALKRDATIAEATYQLLTEQTKTQAFLAGYNSDIAKIYQVAVPPARPSSPKKALVAGVGLVLGLFAGSGAALWNSSRRGWLFSARQIRDAARPGLFRPAPCAGARPRPWQSVPNDCGRGAL